MSQSQYLSTFDYGTGVVTPIAVVPGVHWITVDNTAYDANHQRVFFQGGPVQQPPWNLFTIDAVTGAVIDSPQVPAGNPSGTLVGLQYDNGVDTLYGIYFDGAGNVFFSWVNNTTGVVHPKEAISNFPGYIGCTYDSRDHRYIFNGGQELVSLDARTGSQVYSARFSVPKVTDLVFDNANSTLYGISVPASGSAVFNSIDPASAALNPLVSLPVDSFPQIDAYAIDEAAGNFLFVGTLPATTNCVNYQFYTLNIATAAITGSSLYPYAQDPSNPLDSNLLEYSFDQVRGRLYAMNWRPTLQTVTPFYTISAAATVVCPGVTDLFTGTLTAPLTANSYQWLVNSQPAGDNAPVYTDVNLFNGDNIRCIVTASTACGSILTDTSNVIVVTVPPVAHPSLRIAASANDICAGDSVFFQAAAIDGGASPRYQWQINGRSVGTDSTVFSSHTLADRDTVSCIMESSLLCRSPPDANSALVMTVRPAPVLAMPHDTLVARGQQVRLIPFFQGDIADYQWQPATWLNDPMIADPTASPLTMTTYGLRVTADDGCSASGKVTVRVYTPLAMPDAFTPNGDGRNDVFRIPPSLSIQLSRFCVYDRWGHQVFMAANPAAGWDGTAGGRAEPAGVYVWVVEYVDALTDKPVVANGTVILVR